MATSPPTASSPSFPWKAGDAVEAPWTVRSVLRRDDIRVQLLADDGREVTFYIAPAKDGAEDSGTFSVPGAHVRYEASTTSAISFLDAGRALVARIVEAAGGDLKCFLTDLERARPIHLGLDILVRDRARSAQHFRDFRASLETIDPTNPPIVEMRTSWLGPPILELVDLAITKGVSDIRFDLMGPGCLAGDPLRQLAARGHALKPRFIFDAPPAGGPAAPGPRDWTLKRLAGALKLLVGAGVRTLVTYDLGAAPLPPLPVFIRMAATVAARHCEPLQLRLPSTIRTLDTGAEAHPFADFAGVLEMSRSAPLLFDVRSEDGHPLCLFPGHRQRAVASGGKARGADDGTSVYGEACAQCSIQHLCRGVSQAYANAFGTDELRPPTDEGAENRPDLRPDVPVIPWASQARLLLTDRPDARLRLGEIMSEEELPPWPCVLPWSNYEVNSSGAHGPCCADYLAVRELVPRDSDPATLWNGEHLRSIRRALTSGAAPETCRESCPVLTGGTATADKLLLRGGSAEVVERQITLVEDLLAGREEVRTAPLTLCLAVTSHCNYECIMCRVDRLGPEDQLDMSFYRGLRPWLGQLMNLDANGGEPLASCNFRSFLQESDFSAHPQLQLHLTTNGSYLTPKQLDNYERAPFSSLTISLNATEPDTYAHIHHGVPWERIRENLDALLTANHDGRMSCAIRYSMVILKSNLDQVAAFAEMATRDGVGVRYLLPTGNMEGESIMLDRDLMRQALDALRTVRSKLRGAGAREDAIQIDGLTGVLESRLDAGVFSEL